MSSDFPTVQADPYANFRFRVTGGGLEAAFSKVDGLGGELGVTEYQEGTDPSGPRRLPAPSAQPEITMEKGLTENTAMADWYMRSLRARWTGSVNDLREDLDFTLLEPFSGIPLLSWKAVQCLITKYSPGSMDANSPGIMVESATVVHEGFDADAG